MTKKQRSPKKPVKEATKARREAGESRDNPGARQREFLEERSTPLRPKQGAAPRADREAPPIAVPGPESHPPAEATRVRMMREYRERQRSKLEQAPRPKSMVPGQREAPQAPPANNWVPIGPSVVRKGQGGVQPATSGRTPAIAVSPGGTHVYAGAANGGVWRSDDGGQSWWSLMDAFDLNPTTTASDSLSVGAVAIDNANPARVYVGSGEGDGGEYFGVGPIVTNNGTSNAPSWTTEQAAPGSTSLAGTAFYSLAVDPANADRVVAATYVGLYRREPNGSGGFHWARKSLGGATNQIVSSVVVAAAGGTTTFYAAVHNGAVYRSNDGHTWTAVGTGFPANASRIALACRRDHPDVLYALTENGKVYRLDTAVGTWRQVTGIPSGFTGTQGWYDLTIAVAPDNANRIYIGGSTTYSGGDWSGSLYRCEITVTGSTVTATSTYIGGSVHADIHTIVFQPGNANDMWVGCDGGVFHTTTPTGSGNIFTSCNLGLQTLTMEYLGQHPREDAVLFCGTQDNGCLRFTGEEAWLYSAGGDGGFEVIDWNDPYRVLSTYVYGSIRRSTNGGQRYAYSDVDVPLASGESCRFYAPLAGTPPKPGSPTAAADASTVAFGSIRPWISTDFGTSWKSIPSNSLAADSLSSVIRSLAFASPTRLYAGTTNGSVYRFDRSGTTWTRTQLDTIGGANQLPLSGVVTDITVDATNDSHIYVSFGGSGDWRHVWYFDGTGWHARSGPSAGSANSLIDVQANALVVDPANPLTAYMGADIGIWRSTDGGQTWHTYSEGLPDAAVIDLALHDAHRVLRAATHGRGVWERTLPDAAKTGVELYVRSTQLDSGRFPVVNGLADPTTPGESVWWWRGPDIKLDTPDASGNYQFPLTGTIDFLQFVDTLTDDFQNVATHATATITTRAYVQVHNRGVVPANNVRVMLLLANASAGLPPLPAGFDVNVRNGVAINTANWHTVGFATLNDVRVGFPKIAAFDLPSSMLPQPANLAGNQHQCVLALVHHANDQFTDTQVVVDTLTSADRKAAHKNLTVVQFTGTLPAPPVIVPIQLHNVFAHAHMVTTLEVLLNGYPGKVRVLAPPLAVEGDAQSLAEGLKKVSRAADIERWAKQYVKTASTVTRGKRSFNATWSKRRAADVRLATEKGCVFEAVNRKCVSLRGIRMEPGATHTLFLAFDRPASRKVGESFDVMVRQHDHAQKRIVGGLSIRVEVVPAARR